MLNEKDYQDILLIQATYGEQSLDVIKAVRANTRRYSFRLAIAHLAQAIRETTKKTIAATILTSMVSLGSASVQAGITPPNTPVVCVRLNGAPRLGEIAREQVICTPGQDATPIVHAFAWTL